LRALVSAKSLEAINMMVALAAFHVEALSRQVEILQTNAMLFPGRINHSQFHDVVILTLSRALLLDHGKANTPRTEL